MILTADQRMAAEQGMDVDNPFGRGSTKDRQWPRGVIPYVIDPSLCKFLLMVFFFVISHFQFSIFHFHSLIHLSVCLFVCLFIYLRLFIYLSLS